MATNPIQSAGLRFVRKFGVAFFWAFVFALAFGGAAFFRIERRELEGDPRWHVYARLWLDRLEWASYDWRSRELGGSSERNDDVVLVTVDEETVTNARESDRPAWAMRPWPRDLLGTVVEQAVREGASLVVIDESLADVSPHHCAPCRGESRKDDDELLAQRLEKLQGKVVIGFDWQRDTRRPPDRPLTPFLVKIADVENEAASLGVLQQVLARRAAAYLVRADGKLSVWAGAVSDAKARELAGSLDVKGTATVRSLTPGDDEFEVTRESLTRRLAKVNVTGLEIEGMPRAGALDAPVAPLLLQRAPPAAMTMVPDADGVVRAVPMFVNMPEPGAPELLVPSAPVRAMLQLAGGSVPLKAESTGLKIGEQAPVPVDRHGFLSLRWNDDEAGRQGRGTMKRAIPAWRLLVNHDDDEAGRGVRHHDNALTGRVVVFTDERSNRTSFTTPVGQLSRAAILAQAMLDLLKGQGVTRVQPELDFWLTVAFSFIGAILAIAWSSLVRRPGWLAWVATISVVFVIHAFIARQMFVTQQRWVAMAAPLLACSLTFLASLGYARTLEQGLREFMLRALGGAVRADVFRRVERDLALMRPERRELTMFFSDIEGFTSVANQEEPKVVVEVLQEYLAEMTTIVLDKGGHVDKYLGDGLMVFWGAPVDMPDEAAVACSAALEMQKRFEAKRVDWEKRCKRTLVLRAGIETGAAVVGEMGTVHRVNYTVMGEPVATAFRLESLAKRYGARILVGENVVKEAGAAFIFRDVDKLRLGRTTDAVQIFELIGPAGMPETEWVEQFKAGIDAYRGRKFSDGLKIFEELAVKRPEDKLVERYVKRCERYVDTPPPESWSGVVDLIES